MLEASWHVAVVLIATPWSARLMLRHRMAMGVALALLAGGAVYHLTEYPQG